MNRLGIAAAVSALALLTFFQFPGHTWLQQDSQIYAPILENLRDPSVLRNDILVQHPHVAYTVYDEIAVGLQRLTGLGFREILQAQQIVTRALGIWGLYLLAQAFGLTGWGALAVAALGSLGAVVEGPAVLTLEYEPTPRAYAVPLLVLSLGLLERERHRAAAICAGIAFLYHPLTAVPFWAVFAIVVVLRRRYTALIPLAAAAVVLIVASRFQAGAGTAWLGILTPAEVAVQKLRASYVWISIWPAATATVVHHLLVFAILLGAVWRVGRKVPGALKLFLIGLPLLGVLCMPLSWLLLDRLHWALIPQVQPLRVLLFGTFAMVAVAGIAGVQAAARGRWWEAALWFVPVFLIPAQGRLTTFTAWAPVAVALGLAVLTAAARRYFPAVAVLAFFAIPFIGKVQNYPNLHTPALADLSAWARSSTAPDTVFLFPDVYKAPQPGIFRAEALRAIYVDWKGGGQVNYLKGFPELWSTRWQQTVPRRFKPAALADYAALGIQYTVLQPKNRLPRQPVFENSEYVVYRW